MIANIVFAIIFGSLFYILFGMMSALLTGHDDVFDSGVADAITYFLFWPLFLIKSICKGIVYLIRLFIGSGSKNIFMNFVRMWKEA